MPQTPDFADAQTIIYFAKYPLEVKIADLETIVRFQKAEIERLKGAVVRLATRED